MIETHHSHIGQRDEQHERTDERRFHHDGKGFDASGTVLIGLTFVNRGHRRYADRRGPPAGGLANGRIGNGQA
jgi:hypothetical protein